MVQGAPAGPVLPPKFELVGGARDLFAIDLEIVPSASLSRDAELLERVQKDLVV